MGTQNLTKQFAAQVILDCVLIIEAKNKEEAKRIVQNMSVTAVLKLSDEIIRKCEIKNELND